MASKFDKSLEDLIRFALSAYMHLNNTSEYADLNDKGFKKIIFDSLCVDIVKNEFELYKYTVQDFNNNFNVSFIIGKSTILSNRSFQTFREKILASGGVIGVIEFKQRLSGSWIIPGAFIILGEEKKDISWFATVDSIEDIVELFKGNLKSVKNVYYSSRISSYNLLPNYYNEQNMSDNFLKDSKIVMLDSIASIVAGKAASQEDFAEGGIPYLRNRDIKNHKIIRPSLFIKSDKAAKFSKQLVLEGDILLTRYFGQNKLVLVSAADVPAIASSGLIIIRPFDICENSLYKFLISRTGREVFNRQINRIQKGVTIPTINISDLRKISIPVFSMELIKDFENRKSLSLSELINASNKLSKTYSEEYISKKIIRDLILQGWDESKFSKEVDVAVDLGNNKRFIPDYIYVMPDGRKIIIETKTEKAQINSLWINAVKYILLGENNFVFILTNGIYYEVHVSGQVQSLKIFHPPTLEQIMNWEKEVL